MKGILLAGGTGSRLWPITRAVSKQLLPVYDKPMIYYPLSTLMLAGTRDILLITAPDQLNSFRQLLGDGSDLGLRITYATQPKPEGLAQALIIGEKFLAGENCLMILGDNVFHGAGLGSDLSVSLPSNGSKIFTYEVSNPSQYGILTTNNLGQPTSIVEKPSNSQSNLAVTGLYFFDHKVSEIARNVLPSKRGELEITSVIEWYLMHGELSVTHLSRGTAWLDTGTPNAMHDASTFIRVIEERTGLKIACLEEIAFKNGWIDRAAVKKAILKYEKSSYGEYLARIF